MLIGGVKTITLKNEYGETIEVRRGPDGKIQVRHSDVDPKEFGEFRDYAERNSLIKKVVASYGGLATDDSELKQAEAILDGAFVAGVVIRGHSYNLNSDEARLIRDAIKQLG